MSPKHKTSSVGDRKDRHTVPVSNVFTNPSPYIFTHTLCCVSCLLLWLAVTVTTLETVDKIADHLGDDRQDLNQACVSAAR